MDNNSKDNAGQKPDVFDRIMALPVLNIFEGFYRKNKEVLLYLFFGVLTTAVSFVTAGIAKQLMENAGASENAVSLISTTFSWICAVTFAYVTNRIWVFRSKLRGFMPIVREACSFYAGRLFTYFVELLMMWAGYSQLHFNYWVTKIVANVVVLILNFVISKLFVFKDKNKDKDKMPHGGDSGA